MPRVNNLNEEKLHVPLKEKLKSIPEVFGIRLNEEPEYKVIEKDGEFEIRSYQPQLRASVTISNVSFDEFRETAFKALAAYIFGENSEKTEVSNSDGGDSVIDMTAPVLQNQHDSNSWTMTFILPKKFNLKNVPKPLNPEIELTEVKPADVAACSYAGNNSLEKIESHANELLSWLEQHPKYEPEGPFFSAQYDAPFVIPFLKKNEVQVPLKPVCFV